MRSGARAGASGDPNAAVATANTLNYALGKRHIKSWMTGPSEAASAPSSTFAPRPAPAPPVRKRGRPRKHPSPAPLDQRHATLFDRPPNAPSAERLPPSNSTSPQLANIVTNHDRSFSHGRADNPGFPSPTPSDEHVHGGDVHKETETRQTVNADQNTALQSSKASVLPQVAVAEDPIRQRLLSQKRGPGESRVPVDKRPRLDVPSQPQQGTAAPPSTITSLPD